MDMTAYFLGRAAGEGSGGGGSSVQSDYLQNDSSAKDYIKNRPFYSEGEKTETVIDRDIMPLQETEFVSISGAPDGYLMCNSEFDSFPIIEKGQYNLAIDDRIEQITMTAMGDSFFGFGNIGMFDSSFNDTGEDYAGVVVFDYDSLIWHFNLALKTTETIHTIGLSCIGEGAPIVEEKVYSFKNMDNIIATELSFPEGMDEKFIADKYKLVFNEETYTDLTWGTARYSGSSIFYIGNLAIANLGGADTGENYLIAILGDTFVLATNLPAGDYLVSFEKILPSTTVTTEVIHKIDSKFIPHSDYSKNEPDEEGYIKNRPFYSKITYHKDIVPVENMTFYSSSSLAEGWMMASQEIDGIINIANGGQYNLIIDDEVYPIILKNRVDLDMSPRYFLAGNLSSYLEFGEPDTGESYFIIIYIKEDYFELMLACKTLTTTHKVGLSYSGNTVPLIMEDKYDFSEVEMPSGDIGYLHEFSVGGVQEKDTFNLIFNGETYKNLAWKKIEGEGFYLGNSSIAGLGNDTGEDWLITENSYGILFITNLGVGPHTISMEKSSLPFTEFIQKIDKKFLDFPYNEDSIGNVVFTGNITTANGSSLDEIKNNLDKVNSELEIQVDYTQNDSTAKDYIKNRPFHIEEDTATFEGAIAANGIILDSSEKISQNYIVLKDIEDDFRYVLQMKGGSLVTKQLPIAIQVITPPNKTTYYCGDYFDPTGMVVAAVYNDGTTEIVENYSIPDIDVSLTTIGEAGVKLKAKVFVPYETNYMINVIEFDPTVVLADFDYSKNEDGTYTPTSWKRTSNGQNSTEFVIPNNSLIKI